MDDTLDDQVRRADPDRWLSSRFVADEQARADLIALYAFEAELMAIPTRVTQPLLAEMRYAWWSEQLDGVFAGLARKGHPVLEALTVIVVRHGLERAPFDALIEAHVGRVHGEAHDLDAFYVGPMRLAAGILQATETVPAVDDAGRIWGLIQTGRKADARDMRSQANASLKRLSVGAFPAVAHAGLWHPTEMDAIKRLRLIWIMARGRI